MQPHPYGAHGFYGANFADRRVAGCRGPTAAGDADITRHGADATIAPPALPDTGLRVGNIVG